jgi:hypothetical protein
MFGFVAMVVIIRRTDADLAAQFQVFIAGVTMAM